MLTQEDIRNLELLTQSGLKEQWEGIIKKLSYGNKITVANTGLYSSGKSSLFNALLGRTQDERFPVGAVPTTKTGDREILSENIELIDTPGIDTIDSKDDATAFEMLMQSDIIIMTHNVKTGMLNRAEYEWLKRIADKIKNSGSEISERLIFVSTWIDEIHDENDLQKLRDELNKQVNEIVNNQNVKFVYVSSKRFKTAVEKGKKLLEDASGIPAFRELIISFAKNFSEKSKALRTQELKSLCRASRDKLDYKKRIINSNISSTKSNIRGRYAATFEKWRGTLNRFSSMKSNVKSKLDEVISNSDSNENDFKQKIYKM